MGCVDWGVVCAQDLNVCMASCCTPLQVALWISLLCLSCLTLFVVHMGVTNLDFQGRSIREIEFDLVHIRLPNIGLMQALYKTQTLMRAFQVHVGMTTTLVVHLVMYLMNLVWTLPQCRGFWCILDLEQGVQWSFHVVDQLHLVFWGGFVLQSLMLCSPAQFSSLFQACQAYTCTYHNKNQSNMHFE